ncbi:MAG: hypothetical protein R2791_12390 [Saprospiraceae bacterium]
MGHDWEKDALFVYRHELESVLEIAKGLVPELDIVSLHAKLPTRMPTKSASTER